MSNLPTNLFDAVVEQISPHMSTVNTRQAELLPLLSGKSIYNQIEWEGSAKEFSIKLTRLLSHEELINLLKRLSIGEEQKSKIQSLCAQLISHIQDDKYIRKTPSEWACQKSNETIPIRGTHGISDPMKYGTQRVNPNHFVVECLQDSFDDTSIRLFCYKYCTGIHNQLKNSDRLEDICRQIVVYYEHRGEIDYLWELIKQERPNKYLFFFEKWEKH